MYDDEINELKKNYEIDHIAVQNEIQDYNDRISGLNKEMQAAIQSRDAYVDKWKIILAEKRGAIQMLEKLQSELSGGPNE